MGQSSSLTPAPMTTLTFTGQRQAPALRWIVAGLILPLIIYAARAIPTLADPAIPFDTEHTYLPLARRLLEAPLAFWHNPDVLRTAPGAFVYMALAGADIVTIKSWNLALALAAVALLFDAARRISGPLAAASAAWLCALSPTLITLSVWPMVEPPFLFLVALWFWACARSLSSDTPAKAAGISLWVAGAALALATLTRATYMYWIPAIAFACAIAYLWLPGQRQIWRKLIWMHLIALTCVGGYIAWNASEFDKPAIATGAGAALYFGSNPMLQGQEPPFFGLIHDSNNVTDDLGHLSIAGDARLMAATKTILTTLPALTLAEMYAHKAATLLFFSKSHLGRYIDRVWRVALLILAMCGAWFGRRNPAVWVLAGAAFYQWVVHIPVLYNPRYSISALDTALTLLAAIGIGFAWQASQRRRLIPGIAIVIATAVFAGAWHQRYSAPALPRLDLVPHQRLQTAMPSDISVDGMQGTPFQGDGAISPKGRFSIVWHGKFGDLDGTTLIQLKVGKMSGTCTRALLTGINQRGEERTAYIRLIEWNGKPDLAWGLAYAASHGPLDQLRLDFECTANTEARFSGMGLYEASLGRRVKDRAIQALQ
ncbi:hypothetical protein [Ottowia sp. VDI28]|uniref:hypothetical protein n=1 Tax=Ottowia sp. VDI28 TaxID=3133968 RepID=UPI003C306EA3